MAASCSRQDVSVDAGNGAQSRTGRQQGEDDDRDDAAQARSMPRHRGRFASHSIRVDAYRNGVTVL
jgi:hypothetical protein